MTKAPRDDELGALTHWGFAEPGPTRDELTAAALAGVKTTTSSLLSEYEADGTPLPIAGAFEVLVDSNERRVAVVQTLETRVIRMADVDDRHAIDEGEGYRTAAEYRVAHERYWRDLHAAQPWTTGALVLDD